MRFSAKVKSGKQRGREIGFPTFNLIIPREFNTKFGVYAAKVWLGGGEYLGALHYGPVPTYGDDEPVLEIYVLNYDSDEPIELLEFELSDYLREIRKFDNMEYLKRQIEIDVTSIAELNKKTGKTGL